MDFASKTSKAIGIIPARYASVRFPGKPLVMIEGKPMIQRTYESAKKAKVLHDLVVATDDQRIFDTVLQFGGKCIMTSSSCTSGTERVLEASKLLHNELCDNDIIVNIQGDEPLIDATHIDMVVEMLRSEMSSEVVMSTLVTPIEKESDATSSNIVKCVFDKNNTALYFSRAMIPNNKSGKYSPTTKYWRHIGLYAYRKSFLSVYPTLPESLYEEEELEQLRVLYSGYKIKVVQVDKASPGVDVPQDLDKVIQELKQIAIQ